MSSNGFNQRRADEFADRMVGVLNDGALALMTSIGHRTGLFDTLAELPPATSEAIANEANLNERYVREWLGAMVTGKIVDYDPQTATYSLAQEHAASLTRAATPDNMAMFMQYIPLLGSVEDGIVDAFYHGGGVPYAAFPRFQEVMAEDSGQSVAAALVDSILPLAPGLVVALEAGIDVLDIGCGRGRALNLMAQAFPNSHFTGYDFSKDGIASARAEAARMGLTNVRFEIKDVAKLGEVKQYDLITAFDAIHNQARPDRVLCGIARALRPDGIFLMQDIAAPAMCIRISTTPWRRSCTPSPPCTA